MCYYAQPCQEHAHIIHQWRGKQNVECLLQSVVPWLYPLSGHFVVIIRAIMVKSNYTLRSQPPFPKLLKLVRAPVLLSWLCRQKSWSVMQGDIERFVVGLFRSRETSCIGSLYLKVSLSNHDWKGGAPYGRPIIIGDPGVGGKAAGSNAAEPSWPNTKGLVTRKKWRGP